MMISNVPSTVARGDLLSLILLGIQMPLPALRCCFLGKATKLTRPAKHRLFELTFKRRHLADVTVAYATVAVVPRATC